MYKTIVINVDELWLKGKNRSRYYKLIKGHIVALVKRNHSQKFICKNVDQRLILDSEFFFQEEVLLSLSKVPGIFSIMPARKIVDPTFEKIVSESYLEVDSWEVLDRTFKVRTKRSDKTFHMNSMEVSRELGHHLLNKFSQLKVDVHKPNVYLDIKITRENAFISSRTIYAPGGLPVSSSGHVITLLSGGFDSSVASFLMSKRGCSQTFIFFYAYPFVGSEVRDKIIKLMRVLGQYQRRSKLYIVPLGEFQNKISKMCLEEYRTVLFRKFMLDASYLLAQKLSANAVLTGDSLGQVSSQTIHNIVAIDHFAKIPIFRPLLGLNKLEIINISRKIGTHDISSIPHDDACSMFASKHPVIKSDISYIDKFCRKEDFNIQIADMIEKSEILTFDLLGRQIED